ncbi:MAG: hypothetical protein C4555_00035 [Dehalococcoidia bacterium]|nr:MAG: hypothetical protein C4555_00035 [Dehalococcoidia bacterium]
MEKKAFVLPKTTSGERKMGDEGNDAPGKGVIDRLSLAECEMLSTLASGVPAGQVIVALSRGEDEAATWLYQGANEANGGKVQRLNIRDGDYEPTSLRCKEKVGLWWYNASWEYEEVRKALLSWQGHFSPEARVVLCGYDQPGVARVIRECIGSYGNFLMVDSVGNLAVFAVDRCVHYWVIDYKEFGICKYCGRKRDFKRMRNEASRTGTKRRVTDREI